MSNYDKGMYLNLIHNRAVKELVEIFGNNLWSKLDLYVAETILDIEKRLESNTAATATDLVVYETIKNYMGVLV